MKHGVMVVYPNEEPNLAFFQETELAAVRQATEIRRAAYVAQNGGGSGWTYETPGGDTIYLDVVCDVYVFKATTLFTVVEAFGKREV